LPLARRTLRESLAPGTSDADHDCRPQVQPSLVITLTKEGNRLLSRCQVVAASEATYQMLKKPKEAFHNAGLDFNGTDSSGVLFACPALWGKGRGLHARGATQSYTLPPPFFLLTLLFSKKRLKRKDFQEMAVLAWVRRSRVQISAPRPLTPVFSVHSL